MQTKIQRLVTASACIAIGLLLPLLFHVIPGAGQIFLPMHIPVLICGILCGKKFGLICGLLTPLLSSMITGMPPVVILPGMICELGIYGFCTGLLYSVIRTDKHMLRLYLALILSMIAGRIGMGIANGLIFLAGKYTLLTFISISFVTALPGICIQLVIIPPLVRLLEMKYKRGIRLQHQNAINPRELRK